MMPGLVGELEGRARVVGVPDLVAAEDEVVEFRQGESVEEVGLGQQPRRGHETARYGARAHHRERGDAAACSDHPDAGPLGTCHHRSPRFALGLAEEPEVAFDHRSPFGPQGGDALPRAQRGLPTACAPGLGLGLGARRQGVGDVRRRGPLGQEGGQLAPLGRGVFRGLPGLFERQALRDGLGIGRFLRAEAQRLAHAGGGTRAGRRRSGLPGVRARSPGSARGRGACDLVPAARGPGRVAVGDGRGDDQGECDGEYAAHERRESPRRVEPYGRRIHPALGPRRLGAHRAGHGRRDEASLASTGQAVQGPGRVGRAHRRHAAHARGGPHETDEGARGEHGLGPGRGRAEQPEREGRGPGRQEGAAQGKKHRADPFPTRDPGRQSPGGVRPGGRRAAHRSSSSGVLGRRAEERLRAVAARSRSGSFEKITSR